MRKAFYYKNYNFNYEAGVLTLKYRMDEHDFIETITFPNAPFKVSETEKKALDIIFFYTHIAFGISYYKAFLPPELVIESGTLTKEEADFFNTFYLQGLGEFSVKNQVELNIDFPCEKIKRQSIPVDLKNRTLVPVGGGKDSCVTIELLKKASKDITAFSVGNPRPIKECVQFSELSHIILSRKIAPELLALNEIGEVYNGHVPITGLIAFLLWASGILYDYATVAMSCERSANSGNMVINGRLINHQYSKSLEFEQDFYALTQSITPNFQYFSLLRPYSEAHIGKMFSMLCENYFDVFTSCNKAFKLDVQKRLDRWCGNCDKCRFVFLMLAPFMDKEKLIQIVGQNPLNDASQLQGYEELLGLFGHKPFECVGEVSECSWALNVLGQNPHWKNDFIVHELYKKIDKNYKDIFIPSTNHLIKKEFQNVLG